KVLGAAAEEEKWKDEDTEQIISALLQMLQVREREDRKLLVAALASVPGTKAAAGLAPRALFDLSRDVRLKAISLFSQPPPTDSRPHFLAGLRYPWPPIATHAAAALVGINDGKAVPKLVDMLDEPDPNAPFVNERGHWAVRELTRVNHLRNCLLCHAPS